MLAIKKNEGTIKVEIFNRSINYLNKVINASAITFMATNSFATTLEQGDTMYYFAKQCAEKGKRPYALTNSGQWQVYSAEEVRQQYEYMKSMFLIDQVISNRKPRISPEMLTETLDTTRPKRITAAKSYLACK